jgi:hypothetical protein
MSEIIHTHEDTFMYGGNTERKEERKKQEKMKRLKRVGGRQ